MNSWKEHLAQGQVIPACPLALEEDGSWSKRHQRALLRYYLEAGAGGLAVGVHTTQFEIRDAAHGLFEPHERPALLCDKVEARSRNGRKASIYSVLRGLSMSILQSGRSTK